MTALKVRAWRVAWIGPDGIRDARVVGSWEEAIRLALAATTVAKRKPRVRRIT